MQKKSISRLERCGQELNSRLCNHIILKKNSNKCGRNDSSSILAKNKDNNFLTFADLN